MKKYFVLALVLLAAVLHGAYAEARPVVRLGFYYTEHVTKNEAQIHADIEEVLTRGGIRIGATLVPVFIKKTPSTLSFPLVQGIVETETRGSVVAGSGIDGNDALESLARHQTIAKDAAEVDFVIVFTPALLIPKGVVAVQPLGIIVNKYKAIVGWTVANGKFALAEYDGVRKLLEHTILHELGHHIGLYHTDDVDSETCVRTHFLMCQDVQLVTEQHTVCEKTAAGVLECNNSLVERFREYVVDAAFISALARFEKQ